MKTLLQGARSGAISRRSPVRPVVLIVALLGLIAATTARAADTVIGFDNLPNGTQVISQYHALGVDLDRAGNLTPLGNLTPATVTATGDAHSPPNALVLAQGGGGEFQFWTLGGTFTNPHHNHVQVWIRSLSGGPATIKIYDRSFDGVNGNLNVGLLGQATVNLPASSQIMTALSVSYGLPQIAAFTISTADRSVAAIDDLSFDTLLRPEGPDFTVSYSGSSLSLTPGGPSVPVPVRIDRYAGSTGPITLDVSGLPPGVLVDSITPNPSSAPGGAVATVNLKASPTAPPTANRPVVITGAGVATAGQYGPHHTTLMVSVQDSYDAQITGIEVTQGIQGMDLPKSDSGPGEFRHASYDQPGADGKPLGIQLVTGKTTVVRVFADLRANVADPKNLPGITCELEGIDGNTKALLVHSPLEPEAFAGPGFQIGADNVTDDMRAEKSGQVFWFTLPHEWTKGKLILRATLKTIPVFVLAGAPAVDYNTNNDIFLMDNITFQNTLQVRLAPVALHVDNPGNDPRLYLFRPSDVFADAGNVLPVQDGPDGFDVPPYVGTLDITDLWNQTQDDKGKPIDSTARGNLVAARLREHGAEFVKPGSDRLLIGVHPGQDNFGQLRDTTTTVTPGSPSLATKVAIVQLRDRPLTAVAHEFNHMLGRQHASPACGGGLAANGSAEDWMPDEQGLIQGVGVDVRTRRVLFQQRNDTRTANCSAKAIIPNHFYDYMSYAAFGGSNDPDSWISVKGWQELVTSLHRGDPGQVLLGKPVPRLLDETPTITVRGIMFGDGSVAVTSVTPTHDPLISPDPNSTYHLVARDAAGNVITDVGMTADELHNHDGTDAKLLAGQVPSLGVQSVEITRGGSVVASRVRSAHAPDVQMMGVQPDVIRAGQKITQVQWQASDTDGDKLQTSLEISTDGGNTWRLLTAGPDKGAALLDSQTLPASGAALVRVRVNDGFNETAAMSQMFASAGHAPDVEITSPTRSRSFKKGSSLYLCGQAHDDNGDPISGDKLAWFAGGVQAGTGACLSVPGLGPGRVTLRLQATDGQGRTASQSVTVTIAQ